MSGSSLKGVDFPGLGKYRIVQYGVHSFMIQRRFFGFLWLDVLEYTQWSEEECHKILHAWVENKKVSGRVVWP